MSSRPHIDELYKSKLDALDHEFSEALWQKLDNQLQPERAAYHKKDRKRRALILLFLLLAIGGASTWFLTTQKDNTKQGIVAQTPGNEQATKTAEPARMANEDNRTPVSQNTTTPPAETVPPVATGNNSQPLEPQSPNNTDNIFNINDTRTITTSDITNNRVNPVSKQNKAVGRNIKKAQVNDNDMAGNGEAVFTPPVFIETAPTTTKEEPKATVNNEAGTTVVTTGDNTEEKKKDPDASMPTKVSADDLKKATTVKTKNTNSTKKAAISVMAGTNLSSPFRKPGIFGGVLFTKTIDDKHIFAGIKLTSNQLNHELIIASKQNQPTPVTDAVIEKLTILQLPFGYEFALGRKDKPRTTFLQAGFEPAYITGLRTLYYDDNGIPGGPRTIVVNSPLMAKAVNRFNLSFIAGVRKQVTDRVGISLTGGYSLIDITDKQYYNRTSTNNNLKYVQAGLLLRLNK
jgi:hypothetical protein